MQIWKNKLSKLRRRDISDIKCAGVYAVEIFFQFLVLGNLEGLHDETWEIYKKQKHILFLTFSIWLQFSVVCCWGNLPHKGVGSHKNWRGRKQVIHLKKGGGEVNAWINTSNDWAGEMCSSKVWIVQPWKYNSLLVTNTICLEHWWAHQESEDTPGIAHRFCTSVAKPVY